MATIKVPGLVEKRRKNGATVYYWQPWSAAKALGFLPRALRHPDSTPMDEGEAYAAARGINAELERVRAGDADNRAASRYPTQRGKNFCALIDRYKKSDAFTDLAADTQRVYGYELRLIEAEFGDISVSVFAKNDAKRWLKTLNTVSRRASVGRVLRLLMSYAEDEEWIPSNPLLGRGRKGLNLKTPSVRVVIASYECEAAFVRAALKLGETGVAIAVLAATCAGQRVTDTLLLSEKLKEAKGYKIAQSKRRKDEVTAWVPFLLPRLDYALKAEFARRRIAPVPKISSHWVLNPHRNEDGRAFEPYNISTFEHAFARVRVLTVSGSNALGLPPCPEAEGIQFRDFRDTFITRATEAGCDPIGICAVSGHWPTTIPTSWRHYLAMTPKLALKCLETLMAHEATMNVDKLFLEG